MYFYQLLLSFQFFIWYQFFNSCTEKTKLAKKENLSQNQLYILNYILISEESQCIIPEVKFIHD